MRTGGDDPWDDEQRTRWRARLLVWTGGAILLATVVGLVHAVYPVVM